MSSAGRSGSEVTSRYLPSSRASARILVVSRTSRPEEVWRSQRPSAGWSRSAHSARVWAASSASPRRAGGAGGGFGVGRRGGGLGGGQRGAGRGDPGQLAADPVQRGRALGGLPVGLVGVGAEHPAQVRGVLQADLLDPQVVPHGPVAALAGEYLLDVRCAGRASVRRR